MQNNFKPFFIDLIAMIRKKIFKHPSEFFLLKGRGEQVYPHEKIRSFEKLQHFKKSLIFSLYRMLMEESGSWIFLSRSPRPRPRNSCHIILDQSTAVIHLPSLIQQPPQEWTVSIHSPPITGLDTSPISHLVATTGVDREYLNGIPYLMVICQQKFRNKFIDERKQMQCDLPHKMTNLKLTTNQLMKADK